MIECYQSQTWIAEKGDVRHPNFDIASFNRNYEMFYLLETFKTLPSDAIYSANAFLG